MGWSPVIGMPLRIVSGFARGRRLAVLQRVANDLVVDLDIEPILVEPDARAAVCALAKVGPKRDVHISVARAFRVLQRDQEIRRREAYHCRNDTAPTVDVNRTVGATTSDAHDQPCRQRWSRRIRWAN